MRLISLSYCIFVVALLCFFVSCEQSDHEPKLPLHPVERPVFDAKIINLPTSYLLGETIDLDGVVIERVNDNNTREVIDYDSLCFEYNPFKAGKYPVFFLTDLDSYVAYIEIENILVNTDLPVVYINTENDALIESKTNYVSAEMEMTNRGKKIYSGNMQIRGRGNATWRDYPKKPYKIRLNDKANLLGMGKDRDWVLLPNYCDKSLMRTNIAFRVSELLNFPYTPQAEYVELVLNGEYVGNYQLVEHVKVSDDRVNITDDGFFIERDGYYLEEPVYFLSEKEFGYSFKYPELEDLGQDDIDYAKSCIDDFERALFSVDLRDEEKGYRKYADLNSLARWFLFQQILANKDTNVYFTKTDRTSNSKLNMEPVWDFEWSLGIGWYYEERPMPADFWIFPAPYFDKLMEDENFTTEIKNLWNSNSVEITQNVLNYIEELKEKIALSQQLNFRRWDILNKIVGVGGIPLGSFEKEVECDRQFFINRVNWLNNTLNNLYLLYF